MRDKDTLIFTEAVGCGQIAKIALQSFHATHDREVMVFGREQDFEALGDIREHVNNVLIDVTYDQRLSELYNHGHEGTAEVFARVLGGQYGAPNQIIHFDSDCYFKREVISEITHWFDQGFDLIGSRRCYQNNPANIPVKLGLEDTISTYLFGIRRSVIPQVEHEVLRKMCKGSFNPLGHDVFDFFDPVTFTCAHHGAKIKFLDPHTIGGQTEGGDKANGFESNQHIDLGTHVAHFGGVGSGLAYYENPAQQNASYGTWAIGRYALFVRLFFNENTFRLPPTMIEKGRWVSGGPSEEIIDLVKKELYL